MQDAFAAFARAARNLFEPRILAVVFLPMAGSIIAWTVLAWIFWDSWTGGVAGALGSSTVAGWLKGWGAAWVIDSASAALVVVAIMPAIYVTALVITEIVAMPMIVRFVGERYHPQLARRAGGTIAGSVVNAAAGVGIFALLWILTLPLWLTGIGALLAPLATSAYLNQRLFRYDALAEHASAEEIPRFIRAARGDLFVLGILVSALLYVPVLNLLVPVLSGLAFTHFCLARLAAQRGRQAPAEFGRGP